MAKSSSQYGAFAPLIDFQESSGLPPFGGENIVGNATGSAALVAAAAGHPEALTCIASIFSFWLRSQPAHRRMPKAEKLPSTAASDIPAK
jgi:hypothetical protein